MENYIEVIQQLLALLDTMEEGMIDIKRQLGELRYEGALRLLGDVMLGVSSIDDALEPMMDKLEANDIKETEGRLKEVLNGLINTYEDNREVELEKQVEEDALATFKAWKEEIERVLQPYLIA